MVATPQFIQAQKAMEKTGWNSAQLTGRIKHYEPLQAELSREDLLGVAKSVLPEASIEVLNVLAIYAKTSARYLAAIETISTRARYIAIKARRDKVTTEDVRTAMQESVIPADNKLLVALERGKKENRIRPDQQLRSLAPVEKPELAREEFSPQRRETKVPIVSRAHAPLVATES
jgi:hypothetical protein